MLTLFESDPLSWNRDADRYRQLSRRVAVLGTLKLGLLGTLIGRLYYLQILQSDKYAELADKNSISLQLLAPRRGLIVDRFGIPLAINQQNFRLEVVPEQTKDLDGTIAALGKLVSLSETDMRRIEHDLKHQRRFVPITVRENLTWDQVSEVALNIPDLPGVSPEAGQTRHYPYGEAAAHILGYVAPVSEEDQTGDPVLGLPGFRIGKNGIEKIYDLDLRGSAGSTAMEVNAVGRVVREKSRQEGTPGDDITLTLDIGLQTFTHERLKDELSAAAVVLDVHTGAVYAMASHPSYDTNQFHPRHQQRAVA